MTEPGHLSIKPEKPMTVGEGIALLGQGFRALGSLEEKGDVARVWISRKDALKIYTVFPGSPSYKAALTREQFFEVLRRYVKE